MTETISVVQGDVSVTEEFVDLARTEIRAEDDECRLDESKAQLAQHLLSSRDKDVFDAVQT